MAYQLLTKGGKVGQDILEYLIKQADPRFGNQVGSSDLRKGEIALLPDTRITVEGSPIIQPAPLDLRNYEGRGLVTSMSDKTAAGGQLTKIDGQELSRPVLREGGQDFMMINDEVWGSFPSVLQDHIVLAQHLRGKTGGKDPLFAPWAMTPPGMDYSTMPVNAMLSYIDATATNKLKNAITAKVRQTVPEFVGFKGDWEKQIFGLSGNQRKRLAKALDSVRADTGIGSGKARLSVADPNQLTLPEGSLYNVGSIGKNPTVGPQVHGTYKGSMDKGDTLGRVDQPVMVTQAIPQTVDKKGVVRKVADPDNPTSDDLRSMMMGPKGAIIDDKMLKRMYGSGAGLSILGALAGADDVSASTADMNEIMSRRMNAEPFRLPEEFWTQGNGIGVAQAPAQNPVSQGAEYVAGKLHSGARNLENAGILSLLSAPLSSLGDIASRAAYGESKVTDPAEALLSASAFVPQLYMGGKAMNAMRDKDIQSMLFRELFGE